MTGFSLITFSNEGNVLFLPCLLENCKQVIFTSVHGISIPKVISICFRSRLVITKSIQRSPPLSWCGQLQRLNL